jgi:Do/DeqQ family serine protease
MSKTRPFRPVLAHNIMLRVLLTLIVIPLVSHAALPITAEGRPLPTLAPMIERVTPAVVNISTEARVVARHPLLDDPLFRHFFGDSRRAPERVKRGLGSGTIIDAKEGYIVTNYHVVEQADNIRVTLHDGRRLEAHVIGADPEADVAVIKIKPERLTAIPLADSGKLRVGDFVVAIGNPFGLGQTVTSGIVSALGRSGLGIESYEDFIQTDASINPGNSGGPLVNLRGELVGINTAILGPSGGNIGIGFAIPINMAKQVTGQLIKYGEVRRGRLGVIAQNLSPELARAFGVRQHRGVVVAQVEGGSPAEQAGLRAGDVITAVNGEPITSAADMRNAVGMLRVGSEINMEVMRRGRRFELKAVIGKLGGETVKGEAISRHLAGAELGELQEGMPHYGEVNGVLILNVERDSPAAQAGLQKYDIIRSVNKRKVENLDDVSGAVQNPRNPILIHIQRGEAAMFLLLS